MNASKYVASFDSASSMLKATSRYLRGKDFPSLGNTSPTQLFMVPLNGTQEKHVKLHIYGEVRVRHYPQSKYTKYAAKIFHAGW